MLSLLRQLTLKQLALFVFTYVAYVVIYLGRKPVAVVKPVLQDSMGLTPNQLASVDSSFLTAYAVGQLSLGVLSSVFTTPQLLGLAYLGCGVSVAVFGVTSATYQMILVWACAGFFQAVVNPLLVIWVAELFPAAIRASVLAIWQTSQQLGSIVANGVASGVLHWSGGEWRVLFSISGTLVGLFALPIYRCASEPAPTADDAGKGSDKKKEPSTKSMSMSEVLKMPGCFSVAMSYFFVKMMRYMCMFWLPTYLVQHSGMSPVRAGILAGVFDAGGVMGGIVTGFFVDVVLGGRMLLACVPLSVCAGLFLMALGYAEDGAATTACIFLAGFAIAGPDSILGGAASRNLSEYNRAPEATRAVSGTINGFGSVGAVMQAFGTSGLLRYYSWPTLFGIAGLTLVVASGLLVSAVLVEQTHFKKKD